MSGKEGVAARFTGIAAVVATITFLLAGVGAFYNEVSDINSKLDRNLDEIEQVCLSVRNLQVDLRFHMLNVPGPDEKLPQTPTIPVDC